MAKRRADKQLTEENWQDAEEEECVSGAFKRATDDVLAKRVIKTAKRRTVEGGSHIEPSSLGVFKGFGGFGSAGSSTSFHFGGKAETAAKFAATSFNPPATGSSAASSFSFGQKDSASGLVKPVESTVKPAKLNGAGDKSPVKDIESGNAVGNNKAYLSNLRALNQGVLEFIKKHLSDNININLTPVFDDYKKHFEQLGTTYKPQFSKKPETTATNSGTEISSNGHVSPVKVATKAPPSFSMGCSEKDKTAASPVSNPTKTTPDTRYFKPSETMFGSSPSSGLKESSAATSFSFSATAKPFAPTETKPFALSETKPTESFSFGKKSEASTENKQSQSTFSFGGGSAKPLSFGAKDGFSFASSASSFSFGGSTALPQTSATTSNSTEEDYAPPKAEVLEVKEEGSVFEMKCKLFYKNDGNFSEKGVGTLFLKPVEHSDRNRTQLIVRAATSLGNLLLNIILHPNLPVRKTGKNNVMIICVPNPPIDTKAENQQRAVTMLIRVKNEENALELLKQIHTHQGVLDE